MSAITEAEKPKNSPPPVVRPNVLPLENGDRLHSKEFLRRYDALPELKKAELIKGVVYMGSPVGVDHGSADHLLQGWLVAYEVGTPGIRGHSNTTMILDPDNTCQPDVMLCLENGATKVSDKQLVVGPAELVIEIAASSASIDLRDKLDEYCRSGVREYIVWNIYDAKLHWHVLEDEDYLELSPDEGGVIRSRVFPGLWLHVAHLLKGEKRELFDALNKGLKSPEHEEFVKKLTAK